MADLKTLFLICGVLAGVYGADKAVNIDPEPSHIPPEPTTPATNSTTALPPTTSTTPTKPSTTSITTQSTTSITTTSSTSTTSPPTTSKTTSSPTKPTPTPTPVDPKVANWTVNYANSSRSCIVLSMAAQFEIPHPKLNKTTINLPIDANATGSCEDLKEEKLIISWGVNNSLEFNFLKSNTSKFDLDSIVAKLNTSEAGVIVLSHKKAEFSTPLENSYKCTKPQALNLTEPNSNSTAAYLTISHLQYQAFRNSTEHKFDSALDCEGGSVTTDVVPIVVGCVLAVLVVAVLVAYLFGRRRCQARGYLSMFEESRREADYIPMKNLSCFN